MGFAPFVTTVVQVVVGVGSGVVVGVGSGVAVAVGVGVGVGVFVGSGVSVGAGAAVTFTSGSSLTASGLSGLSAAPKNINADIALKMPTSMFFLLENLVEVISLSYEKIARSQIIG